MCPRSTQKPPRHENTGALAEALADAARLAAARWAPGASASGAISTFLRSAVPAATSFLSPEEARAGAVLRGMRRGAEALTGAALLEAHGRRLLSQAAAAAEARRARKGRLELKRQSREIERKAAAASGSSASPSSSSLSPSARPFAPANAPAADAAKRRTPPRGAAAVGDGDRDLSAAASVRSQAAAAMASVLDQGAVLVAPALPGPPPLRRSERSGSGGSGAAAASAYSRWAQGVAGLGTLAALSGLPRLIVPLPVAEAAARLFPGSASPPPPPPSSSSSSSSSSFRLPSGPPPCVALLGGRGSDCRLIAVGARLAPVLAEEFVKAVAAGRARAAAAAEGGSVNGADDENGTAATGRRSRRAAAGGASPTATAGASPAASSPASPAAKNGNGSGSGGEGTKTAAALVAEALRDEGNAAFRAGDFASAVAHYSAAAAADPSCPLALSNRAAAHLKLLDYEAAAASATLSLQIDHRQPKALLRRGIARAALSGGAGAVAGPVDERRERQLLAGARGDLEAVLALEPGNRQARAELEALKVMLTREPAKTAATTVSEIEPAGGGGGGKGEAKSQEDFFV